MVSAGGALAASAGGTAAQRHPSALSRMACAGERGRVRCGGAGTATASRSGRAHPGAAGAPPEFLLLDPDLIAAAAATSPAPKAPQAEESDIDAWLTTQTADALRVVLRLMLLGQPLAAERRLRGEFLAWQRVRARRVRHRLAPAMQQLGTMQGLQPRRYGTEFLVTLPRNGGHIQQNRRSSSTERATDGSWGRKSARSRRPLVLRERPVTDLLRTPGPTTSRNNLSAPSLHQRDKPRRSAWHPTY